MEVVKKLSHREHILVRPDSYVGPTAQVSEQCWVLDGEQFVQKTLTYSPALLKIFDEVLVNAVDRSSTYPDLVKYIKVDVTEKSIAVHNNGPLGGICVMRNEVEKLWNPELTFGHLLTSTNYDDTVQRVTGGRNGYGAKLANVFSTRFQVIINDAENHKVYKQTWYDNMQRADAPTITENAKIKESSVSITFFPDFERFGMEEMSEDIIKVIEKRSHDASYCTATKCHVFFQKNKIEKKKPDEYVKMYVPNAEKVATLVLDRWSVSIAPSNALGFQHVSFVNGICTNKGGSHVNHAASRVADEIIKDLAKKATLHPQQVKNCLFMVVRATLVNPTFGSQVKSDCTSAVKDFGSRFEPTETFIRAVLKTGIQNDLLAHVKAREAIELKKTDGKSNASHIDVEKLEDAEWAGTKKSAECTLILTEGDSAKALVIAGMKVVGREKYGVFPLRGKCRNVRDASAADLNKNVEFCNIKKILGLQQGKVYTTLSELRYGKVMIMTDADNDGSHIKGLILNMFEFFWPSLLKLKFIVSMVTPIIKASKGKEKREFYTAEQFRAFDSKGWTIKYYKGLGTSTSAEAQEYFKNIKNLTVTFDDKGKAEETKEAIVLAFDKHKADDRKKWLLKNTETPPESINYGKTQTISVYEFIHKDLVQYSLADLRRSIAHVADGLKPSQRKVLFGCFHRNLTEDLVVYQLNSYVAEKSRYHHGDVSLADTIVKMAQDFMGSNNVNFLFPSGQFGTRLLGGSDSASTRYISTRLMPKTRKIFDPRDDNVLTYMEDDGHSIEPEFYVPTLPTVLLNGTEGIGTGYSCYIPPFKEEDIVANIHRALKGEPMEEMTPYFRGFKGTIEKSAIKNKYICSGCYLVNGNKVIITELPPYVWTDVYKAFLEDLKKKSVIESFKTKCSDDTIYFEVVFKNEANVDALKLKKTISTANMHLFHPDGFKKYASAEDILRDFIEIRLKYYGLRKEYLIEKNAADTTLAEQKADFVSKVVNNKIKVFKRKRAELESELKPAYGENTRALLDIKTYQYTEESIAELQASAKRMRAETEELKKKTIETMWIDDLK